MRFYTFLAIAASAVFASPLALTNNNNVSIAGTVTIANGSSYYTEETGKWIKAWPGDVSYEHESRPITYTVGAGFHCIFYTEGSRGPGSPIGKFVGPTSGEFEKWIMWYKCWKVAAADVAPLPLTTRAGGDNASIAGSVTIYNGSTYDSEDLGKRWINHWPGGVSYVYEERPITYTVKDGYTCRYYTQTQRDFFVTVGDFKGPTAGKFDVWVQRYMCWTHAAAEARSPNSIDSLACGFVIDNVHGQKDLLDTGYRPKSLANFAVNGVRYSPEKLHVADYCNCWFYSAHDTRGGAERIGMAEGPVDGNLVGIPTTRYACWKK